MTSAPGIKYNSTGGGSDKLSGPSSVAALSGPKGTDHHQIQVSSIIDQRVGSNDKDKQKLEQIFMKYSGGAQSTLDEPKTPTKGITSPTVRSPKSSTAKATDSKLLD